MTKDEGKILIIALTIACLTFAFIISQMVGC